MYKKIPAILSDINGVLLKNQTVINKRVFSAVQDLRKSRLTSSNIKYQLPFVCITNEFQTNELQQAALLNNQFNLKEEPLLFDHRHIVLSYSPLRRYKSFFDNKKILFIGDQSRDDFKQIADQLSIKDFLTQNEYFQMIDSFTETNLQEHERKLNQSIEVILFFSTPQGWEKTLGIFDSIRQSIGYKQSALFETPSFIAMHNDSLEINSGPIKTLPRINLGGFNEIFKKMHLKLYHFDAKIDMMGKPEKESFEYSRNMLRQQAIDSLGIQDQEDPISNFYMIGDDPYSDIFGANNYGWKSILVRTGVFQGKENDSMYPAKYVVDDFYEAIQLIESLEGMSLLTKYKH